MFIQDSVFLIQRKLCLTCKNVSYLVRDGKLHPSRAVSIVTCLHITLKNCFCLQRNLKDCEYLTTVLSKSIKYFLGKASLSVGTLCSRRRVFLWQTKGTNRLLKQRTLELDRDTGFSDTFLETFQQIIYSISLCLYTKLKAGPPIPL